MRFQIWFLIFVIFLVTVRHIFGLDCYIKSPTSKQETVSCQGYCTKSVYSKFFVLIYYNQNNPKKKNEKFIKIKNNISVLL